jgi:hypothetical protein
VKNRSVLLLIVNIIYSLIGILFFLVTSGMFLEIVALAIENDIFSNVAIADIIYLLGFILMPLSMAFTLCCNWYAFIKRNTNYSIVMPFNNFLITGILFFIVDYAADYILFMLTFSIFFSILNTIAFKSQDKLNRMTY